MNHPNTELFEHVRDTYFINPKDPVTSAKELAEATSIVVEGVAGRLGGQDADSPLGLIASTLADDYINGSTVLGTPGARNFDHLSVAQLHPSGFMPAIVAKLGSSITNNNTIIAEVSPLEARYEQESVEWLMRNIAGFSPRKGSGLLVTGGTMANLHALTVARLKLEHEDKSFFRDTVVSKLLGWAVPGFRQKVSRPAQLFATEMGHYSLDKSRGLLGPKGLIDFVRVPLEKGGYKMDPKALEKRLKRAKRRGIPVLGVVAVAGETETGVVDDLDTIADISKEYGAYLHVDGAYGAPYALSSQAEHLFDGIEKANSVTIDPHKYLYTPYAAGAVLFKSAEEHSLLMDFNEAGAAYMFQDADSRRAQSSDFVKDPYLGKRRLEGSMGGEAAAMVYTTIRTLGREGLAALLDHNIEMTKLFVSEMADFDGLVPAHDVELNSICFRPNVDYRRLRPAQRQELSKRIEATVKSLDARLENKIYIAETDLPCQDPKLRRKGIREKVFRIVFTHPYTGQDEVKYIADTLKAEWEGTTEWQEQQK